MPKLAIASVALRLSGAYDAQAQALARRFAENFEKYRAAVPAAVAAAGPQG